MERIKSAPVPCLRIGILSLQSSLPDVINQFESYLMSELQGKHGPQVQVIRIPHQEDQHNDGTGDHVIHADADADGDDVIRGWVLIKHHAMRAERNKKKQAFTPSWSSFR